MRESRRGRYRSMDFNKTLRQAHIQKATPAGSNVSNILQSFKKKSWNIKHWRKKRDEKSTAIREVSACGIYRSHVNFIARGFKRKCLSGIPVGEVECHFAVPLHKAALWDTP